MIRSKRAFAKGVSDAVSGPQVPGLAFISLKPNCIRTLYSGKANSTLFVVGRSPLSVITNFPKEDPGASKKPVEADNLDEPRASLASDYQSCLESPIGPLSTPPETIYDPVSAVIDVQMDSLSPAPTSVEGASVDYASSQTPSSIEQSPASAIWEKTLLLSSNPLSKVDLRPPPHYLEDLKYQEFSVLVGHIRARLVQSGGQHTQHYLDMVTALDEKYKALMRKYVNKRTHHPVTSEEVDELLNGQYPVDILELY